MWNELNEECIKIDPSVPNMREDIVDDENCDYYDDMLKYVNNICPFSEVVITTGVSAFYFFDHLSTDTIAKILEKYLDGDMEILSFLAIAFASVGDRTASYLTSAMCHYRRSSLLRRPRKAFQGQRRQFYPRAEGGFCRGTHPSPRGEALQATKRGELLPHHPCRL